MLAWLGFEEGETERAPAAELPVCLREVAAALIGSGQDALGFDFLALTLDTAQGTPPDFREAVATVWRKSPSRSRSAPSR